MPDLPWKSRIFHLLAGIRQTFQGGPTCLGPSKLRCAYSGWKKYQVPQMVVPIGSMGRTVYLAT